MEEILNKFNFLERAIISTLAYFSAQKYPLTLLEIWKWLYMKNQNENANTKIKISEIQDLLDSSERLKKITDNKNGFYYLKGDENLIELRKQRHNLSQPRWKKLRRIVTLLQIVPHIKMIAACNTMAINDIREESDLDVFIIIKDGRIWQARFFITLLVAAMGQWRHKKRIASKVCLSWYITDKDLDLNWVTKKPYDILLTYWVTLVYPLLDRDIYYQFMRENLWVKDFLPNYIYYQPVLFERKVSKIFILDILRKFFEKILSGRLGDIVEKFFKKIQIGKMKKNIKGLARENTDVIISDQMLKFHEKDRRNLFREMYEEKLKEFSPL